MGIVPIVECPHSGGILQVHIHACCKFGDCCCTATLVEQTALVYRLVSRYRADNKESCHVREY
jgi:hypothetical protein